MSEGPSNQTFLKAFDTYGDAIFRFCVVKTSDPVLAEDLTQETFMRYWQALRQGKEMRHTRSFLYTIARNLVIDWYRKHKSDSLDQKIDDGLQLPDEYFATGERAAEFREVLTALDRLSTDDAELLTLRFIEGLEPREIGEILNVEPNTISVRIGRAITRLKKELGV